jgi:hypothetical protein
VTLEPKSGAVKLVGIDGVQLGSTATATPPLTDAKLQGMMTTSRGAFVHLVGRPSTPPSNVPEPEGESYDEEDLGRIGELVYIPFDGGAPTVSTFPPAT